MNKDLLECKKKAKELVASENPPCKENGNKKSYIAVMTELWVEKRYEHLGIKSQNLRDQASWLEKMDDSIGETCATDATNGFLKIVTTPVKMLIWTWQTSWICILQ